MSSDHRYLGQIDRLFQEGTVVGLDEGALFERILSNHDEPALSALVERHGPMVLGVCRRLLASPHDVEDAFQATFLILVRKARGLRDRHRLGPWLHGVAYRVAVRARADAARRRALEKLRARQECDGSVQTPDRLIALEDQCLTVDEEIAHLPAKQRAVIVLVDLEGQTQSEAARRLGWSEGSVRGRLARARSALRERLLRRGVAPCLLPGSGSLLEQLVAPSVPAALLEATNRAGVATLLAGRAAPSATTVISASVATLVHSVIRAMTVSKVASLATAFMAIAAGIFVLGLLRTGLSATPAEQQKQAAAPAADLNTVVVKPGRHELDLLVVSRSAKQPVAGATVAASYWENDSSHTLKRSTDETGHCKIDLPPGVSSLMIWIAKDGFVASQESWPENKIRQGLPLTLTHELATGSPIGGLVTDEEGRPVAGAMVSVAISRGVSLGADIDVLEEGNNSVGVVLPSLIVKTNAEGRWHCSVLPEDAERDTRLWFRVEHPDYVSGTGRYSRRLSIRTARAMTAEFPMRSGMVVAGQVHDAYGKSIVSATVTLAYSANAGHFLRTTTDPAGRFVFAHADNKSMLGRFSVSVESVGFSPAWKVAVSGAEIPLLDFELAPGKPFSGQVVDPDGNPVAGASVDARWQECHFLEWKAMTDADGRFLWLNAPSEGEIEFRGRKAGFLWASQRLISAKAGEVKITINPAIRVRGAVTDAKTGLPIPAFQVGEGEGVGNGQAFWRRGGTPANDGRFEVSPFFYDRPGISFFIQITAKGYRPSSSRPIIPGEKDVVIDFKLETGSGPGGLVKLPDGAPAVGADVYLNSPKHGLPIVNNRQSFMSLGADSYWVKTDVQGRFSFEPKDEPFGVLVMHPKGVAQKSASELEQSDTLTLEPFGRIEGTLRIGAEPGARQSIRVQLDRRKYASDHHLQYFEYTALTDDQGRFVIDDVMPGDAFVSREDSSPARRLYLASAPLVDIVSGQTAHVEIGGHGRPIIGKVAVPLGSAQKLNLGVASGTLQLDQPSMPLPEGFMTWDQAKRYAYSKRWSLSAEGKAHSRAGRLYMFPIDADGRFRIEDVLPGSYTISIHVGDPPGLVNASAGGARIEGHFERAVEVKTIAGGRSDEPLDLGLLEIKLAVQGKPPVPVGDIAPAFTIKALDGNPLRLADFKGKLVLLDFWATWCGPCVEQEPHLRATHDKFGKDGRLAIVSLSLDDNPEIAKGHVLKQELRWAQGFLGRDSDVAGNFGVASIPQILLIGPDGRVLVRDLGGPGIQAAVSQALDRVR